MMFQHFDAYVDSMLATTLDQLTKLCRIPSVSAQRQPALANTAARVADLCREAGMYVQVLAESSGSPIILAEAGAGPHCLMLYNHYDVQPPDPVDEWISPPFDPQIREGKLYARGVADNKGDLVARLAAISAYQEIIGPLPLRVLYVIEGEEEVGSPQLFRFAQTHADLLQAADGCLWEFGHKNSQEQAVVHLGVKGILALELHVRTAASDAHSANGGLLPNAAWRLVEALNTLRTPEGRVVIDGLRDHVRPPSSAELALIEPIEFDAAALRQAIGLESDLLDGLTGQAALRRLLFEPTCSINGLNGGYSGPGSKTVIPSRASAKLDIRLVPDLTPSLVLALLRDHLARRGFLDIQVMLHEDSLLPMRTSPDSAIAQAVTAALTEVSQFPPVVYPSSAGSGPMYELCGTNGIPVASTGVAWYGSQAHAPNESIRLADFVEGIKVVGRLLHRFADGCT